MKKMAWIGILMFLSVGVFPVLPAAAQVVYPNRYIELIIPWAPGTGSDFAARFFAEKLPEFLGQPVVPVNKLGGGGTIGSKFVANAKPDGYTLLIGSETALVTTRIGMKDIGYDLDSYRFICHWAKVASYFTVRVDAKWKDLNELISEAKKNPDKLRYSAVMGATSHYAAEILLRTAGAKLTFVPYKSTPEILTALMGGHLDLAITPGLSGMSRSQTVRPLAVAEDERLFDHPEVPTLKELGHPIVMYAKVILCGPKNLPDSVVNKLYEANSKIMQKYKKEIEDKFPKLDLYPYFLDGPSTMKMFKEAEKKYREWAPQMGIKVE